MKMRTLIFTAVLFSTPALADSRASVDSANYACALFDSTGLASSPCAVDGFGSAVVVTMDMDSDEARDLCQKVSYLLKTRGRTFDAGWTLQIRSPYSNGNSIAFCHL